MSLVNVQRESLHVEWSQHSKKETTHSQSNCEIATVLCIPAKSHGITPSSFLHLTPQPDTCGRVVDSSSLFPSTLVTSYLSVIKSKPNAALQLFRCRLVVHRAQIKRFRLIHFPIRGALHTITHHFILSKIKIEQHDSLKGCQ